MLIMMVHRLRCWNRLVIIRMCPSHPPSPPHRRAGQLVTTDHKLKCSNKPRTFRCQQCAFRSDTQGKMNNHFRSSHPPVKCPECDDTFSTPNTLARHRYTHGELTKACRDCDKKFAFALRYIDLVTGDIQPLNVRTRIVTKPSLGRAS